MSNNRYARLEKIFRANHANFWSNISRFTNLLVLMNISMFFLTGLVEKGYYYTFYSLLCLGTVGIGVLIPTKLIVKIWYYWIYLSMELLGLYFLVASILYWIRNGSI